MHNLPVTPVSKLDGADLQPGVPQTRQSRTVEEAHQWQARFYLWLLNRCGITCADGTPFTVCPQLPAPAPGAPLISCATVETILQSLWLYVRCYRAEPPCLMATLTLKNIPEALHRRLKERATRNRRSLNSEAILCLEQALAAAPADPDAYLARIRPLREKTTRLPLTDERLRAARDEGRA